MQLLKRMTNVANDNAEELSVEELRTAERRPIYREVFLHLPEGVRITAVAMDISPLGARVRLARPSARLPDVVEVTVLDECKRERAQIAWVAGNDIGLKFTNPDLSEEAYFENLEWVDD